jgi:hypothetical protein
MAATDIIWTLISLILTLLVFSYLLGDNPAFRLVISLFVGITAGYVAVILLYNVIFPKLLFPLFAGNAVIAAIPLALSLLLVFKLFPRFSRLGDLPMAFLVGSGAAVVIGGAVLGTIFTQVGATIGMFSLKSAVGESEPVSLMFEALMVLAGTIATLLYFQFSRSKKPNQPVHQPAWLNAVTQAGKVFIVITLGALYAGVFSASLSALIERLSYIWQTITAFIS